MSKPMGVIKKLGMVFGTVAIIASLTLWLALQHKSSSVALVPVAAQTPIESWQNYSVKEGDTLASIFTQLKLPSASLLSVEKLHLAHLRKLQAGETLTFLIKQNDLNSLKYNIDARHYAFITLTNGLAHLQLVEKPVTSSLIFKSAVFAYSLQNAAYQAGLTRTMTSELREIFQHHSNSALSLHKNDRIEMLYREYYIDGKKYKSGDIVAVQLIHGDKKSTVFRFEDPKDSVGYYTAKGKSLNSLFLQYPLNFKRISSRFTHNRLDPYLHAWRAHLGVDFAADRGTAVRSIGNGQVIFIGRDGGYGNAIKIRYGNYYEALYGHMGHFMKNIHLHDYVKKGQIIGYVGSSGWSTGPHLHFSFFVRGVPENWLALSLPPAEGVSKRYLSEFETNEHELLNTFAADEPKPAQKIEMAQNTNKKNVT